MKRPIITEEERLHIRHDTYFGAITRFRYACLKFRQTAYKNSWLHGLFADVYLKLVIFSKINKRIKQRWK